MEKKVIAHRVYFDEKYNKPYIRIYITVNGSSRHNEKLKYKLPNKRDYKYINGLNHAVEMSCSKFKKFRELNNLKISECEYFSPLEDDSFYYNHSRKHFFVKVTKKLYETFTEDDIIHKYSFSTHKRKLQIKIEEVSFSTLALEYERKIQNLNNRRKAIMTRRINRCITEQFGKYDNLLPEYLCKMLKTKKLDL